MCSVFLSSKDADIPPTETFRSLILHIQLTFPHILALW